MRNDASFDEMERFIRSALKLKAKMLKLGETSRDVKCAKCPGTLHARLVGKKNHMRLHCDGDCRREMME